MRIAFVAYDGPSYLGGPIVNIRRLLPALVQRGHEPTALIVHWGAESPAAEYLRNQDVPCRVARWACTEEQVGWLLSQVDDLQPQVFIPNVSVAGGFAAHWVRRAETPTILTHRSDDRFNWALVDQFVWGPPQWAVSGLVCVSDELSRRVESRRPQHTRVCTIPSGVPFPPTPLAAHKPFRIVYVGRLIQEQKRIQQVVETMCDALARLAGAEALVIGEGPQRPRLEALVHSRGLGPRLQFAGPVANDRLQTLLAGASVVVLLSDYEGTPGALMDTMACGIVPVCRNTPGGVSALVQHEETGLVVADTRHAAAAIQRLAEDDRLWRRLSRNARQRVQDGFTLEIAAQRWERFCAELVEQAGPQQRFCLPQRVELPAVHPGLAAGDPRRKPLWRRSLKSAERRLRGLRDQVLGWAPARKKSA